MVNLLAPDDAKTWHFSHPDFNTQLAHQSTEALSLTSHDVLKLWYFLWIIVNIVKVKRTLIFVPFISVHNMYFQLLTYFLCLPWDQHKEYTSLWPP